MSSQFSEDYLIVAAIDFGTSYSGYAYSTRHDFKRNPTEVSANRLLSGNYQSLKTPTCILFDSEKKFDSFGYQAQSKYADLASDGSKGYKKWYFFQRFKMKLYKTQKFKNFMISDENGKEMLALDVFSSSISYLKNDMLEHCKNQLTGIGENDIRWVITVPAIWSEAAKSFMRKAAEKCVCGTVDITVHQVEEDGKIKELKISAGNKWGGTKVDKAFFSFLESQIGGHSLKKYKREETCDFVELYQDFELKKRQLNESINLRIPSSLRSLISQSTTKSKFTLKFWKKSGSENKFNNDSVTLKNDKLKLKSEVVYGFFEKSVAEICKLLGDILKATKADYILMVGGYSESKILQDAVKHAFSSNSRIIIPREASLSVLKGAVILGHDPTIIRERICKNTYGVVCSTRFVDGIHPNEYKFWKDGMWCCGYIFQKQVTVGQTVVVGEYQTEDILTKFSDSEDLSIAIYLSPNEDPKYVTDQGCSKIGVLNLKVKDGRHLGNSKIKIEMSFSGTEIQAKATCMATGAVAVVYLDHPP
ncbi:heat shock 70 kDa protein 12A-like [Saccostrea cucullata]|uniref:heat shock 70 kDa protein 12A-like n=1 Tax=Saccostrea cuccullata TaxID=36930 RepID=UPI002ED219F2